MVQRRKVRLPSPQTSAMSSAQGCTSWNEKAHHHKLPLTSSFVPCHTSSHTATKQINVTIIEERGHCVKKSNLGPFTATWLDSLVLVSLQEKKYKGQKLIFFQLSSAESEFRISLLLICCPLLCVSVEMAEAGLWPWCTTFLLFLLLLNDYHFTKVPSEREECAFKPHGSQWITRARVISNSPSNELGSPRNPWSPNHSSFITHWAESTGSEIRKQEQEGRLGG